MGKKWSLCKWERYPIRRDGIRNNWRNCRQRVGRRERAPIVLRGTTGRLRSLPVSIFLSWLRRQTMIAFFSLSPYQPTLIRLMNKLRPGSIGRIDPREDGKLRMSNVTKFLASCSANGLSPEDIFHRDDLVEATSDSLARVSKTIIALVKWAETPVQTRSRISRGSGILKPINTSIAVKQLVCTYTLTLTIKITALPTYHTEQHEATMDIITITTTFGWRRRSSHVTIC